MGAESSKLGAGAKRARKWKLKLSKSREPCMGADLKPRSCHWERNWSLRARSRKLDSQISRLPTLDFCIRWTTINPLYSSLLANKVSEKQLTCENSMFLVTSRNYVKGKDFFEIFSTSPVSPLGSLQDKFMLL